MKKLVFSLFVSYLFFCSSSSFAIKTPHYQAGKPEITKELYGETEGQKIYQYTLKNSKGMLVKVINYGGTITEIITPDKNGEMGNVVLGFDSLKSYTGRGNPFVGASIGRFGNRIANKKFTLDGKEYILTGNLHGGASGFHKKIWNIEEVPGNKEIALKMTYFSKDGEEGYPGNLNVTITYILTNDNELKINYKATTDKATPVNLTNHSYFNLSGGKDAQVLNTELTIAADKYTEVVNGLIPSGKLPDVKGTPFDFTSARKIGDKITENNAQLTLGGGGYDHNFVLRNTTGKLKLAASAYEPLSGRVMQVYSTEPGIQFYSGNGLSTRLIGKGGKPLAKNGAFCLEPQHFPDSPNQPAFPNTVLKPGETYSSQTIYRFAVRK